MTADLVKRTIFSSPVYVRRCYSTSGETVKNFEECEDVRRYRGECVDGENDTLKSWLEENTPSRHYVGNTSVDGAHEHYLFMGENRVLCDLALECRTLSTQDGNGVPIHGDSVWRNLLTVKIQPVTGEIPQELRRELTNRGYTEGKSELNKDLLSFPAKS